jgi:hypothetical protein
MFNKIVYAIKNILGGSRGNTSTKGRTKYSDTRNRTRRAKARTVSKQTKKSLQPKKNTRISKSANGRKNKTI